jgi:hypothetical protein
MKEITLLCCFLFAVACRETVQNSPGAQEIVDRSIRVSGGDRYTESRISFSFRDLEYVLEPGPAGRVLKRINNTDTARVTDIRKRDGFERLIDGNAVEVPDSMASRYSNSINSVHYFAYLPFGLNDAAVNKELLGEVTIGGQDYYEVKITFDRQGGGKDYEDVYVYWFNKATYKPDYLAYEFDVDGGGLRFRKAYNERYIGGIRFVDYENYQAETGPRPDQLDSLYVAGELELLSRIELNEIAVNPGSYN